MKVHWTLNAYGKERGNEHLQAEWMVEAPVETLKGIVPPRDNDVELYASYFPLTTAQVTELAKHVRARVLVDHHRFEYALECYKD